jgi:hypothetical protein
MIRLCPYCKSWGARGRRRGHAFVGRCPTCHRIVVELLMTPKERRIVERIKNDYLRGKTMPQIAFELNRDGIPSWMGKKWNSGGVRDVLCNELYVGRYRVGEETVPVAGEPIMTEEEFKRITEIRQRFKLGWGKRPPISEERRRAAIDKVFGQYFALLREEDELERLGKMVDGDHERTYKQGGRLQDQGA